MSLVVNDQVIDEQAIRSEASMLKERLRLSGAVEEPLALEIEAREWARENIIQRVLLEQAAGASSPEELLTRIADRAPRPNPKEIAAHYLQFKEGFFAPELIHAAHIVKNIDESASEEQAATAMRTIEIALQNGADFADLADRHSDCPGNGGGLGFFARGEMVTEFEAAVLKLQPGQTSTIFRSPFGLHIAKLIEKRPAAPRPLNEVRHQIEQELWNQRKQQAVAEFLHSLRAAAKIRKA